MAPGSKVLFHRFLLKRALDVPPFIIAGMHRSGTTLLARILERCGVFMGIPQTMNGESTFFQNINKEALDMLGCSWRCTEFLPETDMLYDSYTWLYRMVSDKVRQGLIDGYWKRKSLNIVTSSKIPWGWKDPRNSLLLPVWHKVFPNAMVIHIYRDGRDVALSILNREIDREKEKNIFSNDEKKKRIVADIQLWETYIRRIQEALASFRNHYTIKYEHLLASPELEIEKLWRHFDLPVHKSIGKAVSIVDPDRAGRFTNRDFSWICELAKDFKVLKKLGYS